MKKAISSITLLVMVVIVLTGCGGVQTKTFTGNQQGIDTELVYEYKGDKVTKQTAKSTFLFSAVGAENKEEAKAVLEPLAKQYQGIDGLEESIEYKDDRCVEKVSIDYSKVDAKKLEGIQGMMMSGDVEKGISMKATEKMLIDSGFKVKK